jgi:hypothetical protein
MRKEYDFKRGNEERSCQLPPGRRELRFVSTTTSWNGSGARRMPRVAATTKA